MTNKTTTEKDETRAMKAIEHVLNGSNAIAAYVMVNDKGDSVEVRTAGFFDKTEWLITLEQSRIVFLERGGRTPIVPHVWSKTWPIERAVLTNSNTSIIKAYFDRLKYDLTTAKNDKERSGIAKIALKGLAIQIKESNNFSALIESRFNPVTDKIKSFLRAEKKESKEKYEAPVPHFSIDD